MTQETPRILLVTGPSGAGRLTAIHALEDLGYEIIDNLPLRLVPHLMNEAQAARPLALGIDVRNRDFSLGALIEALDTLGADPNRNVSLVYLDARADVLMRRYSETRRRHPLSPEETAEAGILRELEILQPVRSRADVLIDTSELTPHDLRAEISRWFDPDTHGGLSVSVESFSFKRGTPRGLDMVFDGRFLNNPYWEPSLRKMNGRDPEVQAYVGADPNYDHFFTKVHDLIEFLLPQYLKEGKSYLSIGFGCTGGQHRSVALAENLFKALATAGWQVSIRHWELERHASARP